MGIGVKLKQDAELREAIRDIYQDQMDVLRRAEQHQKTSVETAQRAKKEAEQLALQSSRQLQETREEIRKLEVLAERDGVELGTGRA